MITPDKPTLNEENSFALSVILPVFRADENFVGLITDLANQKTSFPFELIIVDDHSPDDTVARIHQRLNTLSKPFINLLCMPKNVGPAGARNHAISLAKGEVFLLIDSDCSIESENYINQIYKAHSDYPKAIIGGGVNGYGRGYIAFADRYCHWSTNIPAKPPERIYSGHSVTANMLIPRTIFYKIGPLDETLRTGEDTAFCLKAHQNKIEIRLHGELIVNHHDRENLKDFMKNLLQVGRDRVSVRRSVYGQAPWFLGGPAVLRWLMSPIIAMGLTLKNITAWWPYDKKVLLALPGILLGMIAIAVGVALGKKPNCKHQQ